MAGYVVKGAAVAARVAGADRYYERGTVLPSGVENIEHLLAVGLIAEVVEVVEVVEDVVDVVAPKATPAKPKN